MEKMGTGRFHCITGFIISIGMISTSFWLYALGFFLQVPDYLCTFDDGKFDSCTQQQICEEDSIIVNWEIDWTSERSFNNWVEKFDLTCAPDWKIALPGVMFFVGLTLTTVWLPPLSDIYGRKSLFIVAMGTGLLFHFGMYITSHWSVIITMTFLLGLITSLRIQVGYNYLIEFFPKSRQVFAGTCWCIMDALVFMITTLYFWKVDRDWSNYFFFVFGANIIGLIGTFFLPESPLILHNLGKEDEAI